MWKRNYTHVQALLPEIKTMLAEGKTRQEVAEHYGFQDKQVVKKQLERERARQRKLEAGIIPRPKGRPWLWLKTQNIFRNPQTVLRIMKKYDLLSEIRRRRKWLQMGQQVYKYRNLLLKPMR